MQVEVIRNAYEKGHLPNLKNAVHRFTTAPQYIRDEVLKYLHSPRTSTDDANKAATAPIQMLVESVTRGASRPASISSEASKSSKKGKAMQTAAALKAEASGSKAPSVIADDESDEWEDDPVSSSSEPVPEPLAHLSALPKKKQHRAPKGRRRESFRRSALARRTVGVESPTPSDSGDVTG